MSTPKTLKLKELNDPSCDGDLIKIGAQNILQEESKFNESLIHPSSRNLTKKINFLSDCAEEQSLFQETCGLTEKQPDYREALMDRISQVSVQKEMTKKTVMIADLLKRKRETEAEDLSQNISRDIESRRNLYMKQRDFITGSQDISDSVIASKRYKSC